MAKTRSKKVKRSNSRKQRSRNVLRKIRKTTARALPVVKTGLKKVGDTVETVAEKSVPIVNKGLEGIYGTLATGFDMGVKGTKRAKKIMKLRSRSKSRR